MTPPADRMLLLLLLVVFLLQAYWISVQASQLTLLQSTRPSVVRALPQKPEFR